MKRTRRKALILLAVASIAVAALVIAWGNGSRLSDQPRLNLWLDDAIRRHDTAAALAALNAGVDPNAPVTLNISLQARLYNSLTHRSPEFQLPPPLLIAIEQAEAVPGSVGPPHDKFEEDAGATR